MSRSALRSFWAGMAALICCVVALAGCQAFGAPAQPASPTPLRLTEATRNRPTPSPVTPAGTPTAAVRVVIVSPSPTPTVAPSPTPTFTPARVMAVGRLPSLAVRGRPQANGPLLANIPGAQIVWIEGRSADGRWVYAVYDEAGGRGWLWRDDLALWGELEEVAVVEVTAATTVAPTTAVPGAARASAPQVAARPMLSGKIVFQTASGGDIYLVNADGSGLRRLTDGMDPALSPDGTRVALARWGAPHGVFVLDLRTGQEQRLASVNQPRGPTWSGDGRRLAFTHVTRTRTCIDLGFACLEVEEVRRLFGGQDCTVTPQGRRCIGDYPVRRIDDNGLELFDLEGGVQRNLIGEGTIQSLQWRPGQEQLLFRGRTGLQTIRPGERPAPLINDPNLGSPAWSPDGQRIAAQLRIHDRTEIVLLDAAGALIAHLTQPPPTYERPGLPAPHNVAPAWSPDGRSLIFLSNRTGTWRLHIMDADGANQRLFLPDVLGAIEFRYDFAAERVAHWGR